ncbi:ADP-ribosylation factor family-domain-containing protein [Dunaliella salina]|uniref:ADP-ribosylation factor family-domain-containing protein n=1 Tax=Dunaliella salina TaxID=3046 RepID=A0ABZ3LN89_DUNSA|nr:ADP-ribosylation factor family-domain-containing protein [Dunaliella salina]|eukprot:KAF5842887.1 ADP-ribosylation factor family-domain-containing protein [Dunaliella salina]
MAGISWWDDRVGGEAQRGLQAVGRWPQPAHSIRRVWKSYLAEVHGVVFVVDAADRGRFDECQQVLLQTIDQKHLHGKPILVLANKQDLNGAASSAGA